MFCNFCTWSRFWISIGSRFWEEKHIKRKIGWFFNIWNISIHYLFIVGCCVWVNKWTDCFFSYKRSEIQSMAISSILVLAEDTMNRKRSSAFTPGVRRKTRSMTRAFNTGKLNLKTRNSKKRACFIIDYFVIDVIHSIFITRCRIFNEG